MKKIALLLTAALSVGAASAALLSPEVALQRAMSSPEGMQRLAAASAPQLIHTATARDAERAVPIYLFCTDERTFVVAGSDLGVPLLGVLDTPQPNGALAPGFEYWLDFYSRQLSAAEEAGVKAPAFADYATPDHAPIEPMLLSRWDQLEPFNQDCPKFSYGKAATGCLATAMTQVMYYHRYPEAIPDALVKYSFYPDQSSLDGLYTINEQIGGPIDWDNIEDFYPWEGYSPETAAAVADFSYRVAVACNMMFGARASSAYTETGVANMVNYLTYDRAMYLYYRDFCSAAQWDHMVYSELAAGRPLMYAGQGSGGGHQFVCDGYQGEGYYHINWGWRGVSDGYFLLNALHPEIQGVGGGYDFNELQNIVVGVKPAEEGSASPVGVAIVIQPSQTEYFMTPDVFRVTNTEVERYEGNTVLFPINVVNTSWAPVSIVPAVELVNTETGETLYIKNDAKKSVVGNASTVNHIFLFNEALFPQEGTYKVYPAYYAREKYSRVLYDGDRAGALEMTCTPESIVFAGKTGVPDSSWDFPTYELSLSSTVLEMEAGEELTLTASVLTAGADADAIEWASQNRRIVKPEGRGASVTLRALSAGTTTVRAALDGSIVECTVIVTGELPEENTGGDENENEGSQVSELEADLPTEYYNLQGMRISRPESGLYIEKRGNNFRKITIDN